MYLQDPSFKRFKAVTGPGRSGAIASVYASHILSIPFIPHKHINKDLQPLLIIDTAQYTGRTLRKFSAYYKRNGIDFSTHFLYNEPPIVRFWYENRNSNYEEAKSYCASGEEDQAKNCGKQEEV